MLVRYRVCMGITAVAVLLAITGCGKKDESETQTSSYSDMPQLESSAPAKDSVDIFDEFYDGETEQGTTGSSPEVETTETTESYSSAAMPNYTPDFAPDGPYVVQVSTVASHAIGEDVAKKFEDMGYPTYLAEVQNPTADLIGTYYRIRIGGFNTIGTAKQFGNNALAPRGYDFWVDYRSNDNVGMGGDGLGESSTSDYQDSYGSESSYGSGTRESSYGSGTDAQSDSYESSGSSDWGDESSGATTESSDEQSSTPQSEEASTTPQPETTPESAAETQQPPAPQNDNPATSDDWSEDEWGDDDWSSESSW